ncbi:hypothetical protein [Desertihabitans aurantiacus]|uniref:hypothetical protein n=1 Tax=Desertihabitans aurantiacus TaxID=2282477 RepID=UPI000DF77E2A|nr:hypothetical protein [Desertihabitans aurantiacus]
MLSRRTLLTGAAAATGAGLLAGCGSGGPLPLPRPRASCVPRASLRRVAAIGGAELVYEENGRAQPFLLDPGFADQLGGWLDWWVEHSGLPAPDQLWTFGTWIDGGGRCDSWHHAGRAFDVTSLRRDGDVQAPGRMDRVDALPATEQPAARRRYWQLVAGLSRHFADVLTSLFDEAHRNHVHVDNGRSGNAPAVFTGRSDIQNRNLQAVLREVWGAGVEITGDWDRATRRAADAVLEPLGRSGDLTDEAAWDAFCTASVGA